MLGRWSILIRSELGYVYVLATCRKFYLLFYMYIYIIYIILILNLTGSVGLVNVVCLTVAIYLGKTRRGLTRGVHLSGENQQISDLKIPWLTGYDRGYYLV